MAQRVVCDKCGIDKPRGEAEGWHIPPDPRISMSFYGEGPRLDLCESCFEDYLRVTTLAEDHKKELIDSWLKEGG